MSTVSKAIDLLNLISATRPAIGLAEFQRLGGRDKATTYRYLSALVETGLLEQDAQTRAYRLGPAVLRLAHIREVTVPREHGVDQVLPLLAEITGETAHASILQGNSLMTLAVSTATRHSARVVLDNEVLPLHATGSGIAVLAYADSTMQAAAYSNLKRYTNGTTTRVKDLKSIVQTVRKTGFGISEQGFEQGVHGIGVPVFDSSGTVAGAVAVASVSSRVNDELIAIIKCELIVAARQISHNWGGTIPDKLNVIWDRVLANLSNFTTRRVS